MSIRAAKERRRQWGASNLDQIEKIFLNDRNAGQQRGFLRTRGLSVGRVYALCPQREWR